MARRPRRNHSVEDPVAGALGRYLGGGDGLAHAPRVELEALHNHGCALLHGCRGGGTRKVWGFRGHEHRPRQPVHQPSVHSNAEG